MGKKFGSYYESDVKFLLKDVSSLVIECGDEEREKNIQNGGHYSEMIPIEYEPSEQYINLYKKQLEETKEKLAYSVGIMSEKIVRKNGSDVVLVSLARAGTPIGILAKRYIKLVYRKNVEHYSISIIRDKGIDENALRYIMKQHPTQKIQFIDGWTGKGTITNELQKACDEFNKKYKSKINASLAVIADPAGFSDAFGVREDFLIPSACLNATVSGLVSRTLLSPTIIKENDFHGAKYYKELEPKDESKNYVDIISTCFENVLDKVKKDIRHWENDEITKIGSEDVEFIKEKYNVENINFIKPGIGETTRVLLRRIPDKVLVDSLDNENLKHILILAKEKNVEVEEVRLRAYSCCGIIKNLKDV